MVYLKPNQELIAAWKKTQSIRFHYLALAKIAPQPLDVQRDALIKKSEGWKGDQVQGDDICVAEMRIA